MNREILNITSKVLSEEIEDRVKKIKNKIFENNKMKKQMCSECGGRMYEGECMECGNMYEGDIQELGGMEDGHPRFGNKNLSKMSRKEKDQLMSDRDYENRFMSNDEIKSSFEDDDLENLKHIRKGLSKRRHDSELGESLKGNQRRIDKNKNNKIDAEDFRMLRRGKKSETKESNFPDLSGDNKITRKDILLGRGVKLNGRKSEKKESECTECGSKYMSENRRYRRNIWESAQEMEMELNAITPEKTGRLGRILEKLFNGKTQEEIENYVMNKPPKWWSKFINWLKSVAPTGPDAVKKGGPVIGLAAIAAILIDTYKRRVKGLKNPESEQVENECKECGGMYELHLDESTGQKFIFRENEIIEIIENIVLEEKKKNKTKKTKNITKSSQSKSKTENDKYIDGVVKKMKDYLKKGSKGNYEMNPKTFPKGNGEIEKMNKMAYVYSDAAQEYIDNFTGAGLENLHYDEIHPNDEWVTDNIVGSSRTGNNPKWANSVETGVGEKRNKIRKNNLLTKVKHAAYQKDDQPIKIDSSGENHGDTVDSLIKKYSSKNKVKKESIENEKVLTEIYKMKKLIRYNEKTQ